MSRENVEIVRRIMDAWNRGDFEGWMAHAHPQVEWSSAVLRALEGRDAVHRGRAELREFWDDGHAAFAVGELADALRGTDVEADDDGVVDRREVDVVLRDGADAAVDDPQVDLVTDVDLEQRLLERLHRAGDVAL